MFTPREAMAYKGQLPEQRNSNLSPDLRNLLAIQKIMREKKDSARIADEKLAQLMGGPNQPTVADALKQQAQQELQASQEPDDQLAEQSQPQKMGLAALAAKNQGVAQAQQAPQAPPQAAQGMPQGAPQGAPQMMAAGGLASAKSNLPSSYQNGGIVAFDAGGPTGDAVYSPEGILISGTETTIPAVSEDETLRERMGLGNKANRMVLEGIGKPVSNLTASTDAAKREVANASMFKPEEGRKMYEGSLGYVPPVPVSAEEMRRGERDTTPVEVNPFDIVVNKVLSREGGKVANDAGKGMTNFGINKTANPDVDVENLTRDSAKDVYKLKYWDAIGGNALAAQNPVLAEIAFDTAVNQGQSVAKKLLAESKGDVERFNELRKNSYEQIAKNDKTKAQYLPAWLSRADSSLASAQGSFKQGVYSAPVDRVAGKETEYPGGLASIAAGKAGAAREPNATSDYVNRTLDAGALERGAEEAVARRREAYGGLEAANLKQMQDYIAQKKASNLAAQPSEREQWAAYLGSFGNKRGQEFAGVAEKALGREAAQRAFNEKSLDEINLLTMAMEQARASGKIGDYKTYEEKLKDLIGQQEKASTVGASLTNTQEITNERRARQQTEIAAKVAAAAKAAVDKGLATQAQVARIVTDVTKEISGPIMMQKDYQLAMKAGDTRLMNKIVDDAIMEGVNRRLRIEQVYDPTKEAAGTMASTAPVGNRPALGSFQR